MKTHWNLLALSVAAYLLVINGLKLVDNGYEDIYIVIQETVPENDELLDRIKDIFTAASALLYTATHRRTYFRSVKVIIPKTWNKNDSNTTVSPLVSLTSHIRVGNGNTITPHTVGSEKCGQEGMYIYLHDEEFVLKDLKTTWGKHDAVVVHEWGHLRWGLKDEYPTIKPGNGDPIITEGVEDTVVSQVGNTINFYPEDGIWKPVGCPRDLSGYASTTCKSTGTVTGNCDQDNTSIMMGDSCKYCPEMTQTVNASIMGFQYISSLVEFCDKDGPDTPVYMRHNSQSINEQNKFCDGKSAWEIMREHEDFKDGNNPPLSNELPPPTDFHFAQEISDRVRVLVLDTSGSMAGEKIINLYQASKYVIESLLPQGSWLSIIDFDNDAVVLSPLVQIDSELTRQYLVSILPTVGNGGTCIPCGLDEALSVLNDFTSLSSIEESEIILISDGENVDGILETATQHCVDAGVVVHCVAFTEAADQRLVDIATKTGGRLFAHSGISSEASSSLAALFSEIISGGLTSDSQAAATMMNKQFTSSLNVPVNIDFNIDEGIGKDTTVSVITKEVSDIEIRLTGSNSVSLYNSGNQVKTLSLVVPGISQQGQYTVAVTSSTSSNLEVIVTSKPTSSSAEIIRPLVRLSTKSMNFTNTDTLPIMYVYLRKGESPIKRATVQTRVEGPSGTETCVLSLLDNGVDPDIKSGDGIYTAVVLRECQEGNGRHSSTVVITGTHETVVTHYTSSRSAIIDVEAIVAEDTATGSFERVAVADAYTVNNYDVSIANNDTTPPGRITDVQVIDIQSGIPTTGLSRNYTITWTATGDDVNSGQASRYEMRISSDPNSLRHDFVSAEQLNVSGVNMAPNVSGKVERLQMTVSSNDAFTATTYFAIVAIDEVGNRGVVSNIIPITIGLASQFEVIEEECTDDCYAIIKDCGRSLTITNGKVNFTNVLSTAGHSVPVICDIGYELKGGASIDCLNDGTWSQTVSCDIVGCGGISIANGEIDFSQGTNYNATATVKCSDGYHLNGLTTVECMASGEWNKSSTCEIKDCGNTVTIPHGQVDFTNTLTTYAQSILVICDSGYKLAGGVSIVCLADGTWSKTVTCEIIDCGATSIANGEVEHSEKTHYNSTANILCDSGYHITGLGTITCLLSGLWSTESECIINDCGTSLTISNGHVDFTDAITTYGHTVPVICDTGYELKGGTSIECLPDGNWKTATTCEIIDCGSTSIANGEVDFSAGTEYNTMATVRCDDGYRIDGSGNITCLSSGLWSTNSECILKDCGNAMPIPNGLVDFTNASTTFGQSLPVKCETGYELEGGSSIDCWADGNWRTTATCDLIDCKPTTIANGEVQHTSGTKYNASASVNCHAGYEVEGTGSLVCLATGLWSIESQCVLKDCGRSETVANGQVNFANTQTTYSKSVPVICDIGYKLIGGTSIECLADGTWSKTVTCEIVGCGSVSIANGEVTFPSGTDYNAAAFVTCSNGYHLTAQDHTIVCLNTGIWNISVHCKKKDCGQNVNIANGHVNFTNTLTTYGQSLPVTCDRGYKLAGGTNIHCLADGSWSKATSCQIMDCGATIISNGVVSFPEGTKYKAKAKLSCDIGFSPSDSEYTTCLETELWSTESKCTTVDCGNNVIVIDGHANFVGGETTYGQSIPIICDTGFKLKGAPYITCLAEGTWSAIPVCDIMDCGSTLNVINGQANFTSRSTTFGQTVPVICNTGYKLRDVADITCMADGMWSMVPVCDVIDKSEFRTNPKNIVTITGSCFGLFFLVIIGLLIQTVIRKRRKLGLRKGHMREIPPDYPEDSVEDGGTYSSIDFRDWHVYNKRGLEYLNPNWNGHGKPLRPYEHGPWHRY